MGNNTRKVLIIDDEAVFREAINTALTRCGYVCVAEENPADGINRLKTETYDLILLDIMMDPLDGWDTLDLIRTISRSREVPVIMSSAKKLQADEVIRYGDHVAGFLTKPFQDDDFCAAVSAFFSWSDRVHETARAAQEQGVPASACDDWVRLSRQIQAIVRLKEVVSPRCIPDDGSTEEECLARKMGLIDALIQTRITGRDDLQARYPALAVGPDQTSR